MTQHKPKEGVDYIPVRELKVGDVFAHPQAARRLKTCTRIDEPDRKGQIRVWYRNDKDELRSMALFAGTKLINRNGYKPKYKFIGRKNRGSINGLIPCYEFSEVDSDITKMIPVRQFWR